MEWPTVLLSGVVAGFVSALVSWIGGLHRDERAAVRQKRAAEAETLSRREDVRRQRLTDALVDFLALDRERFDGSRKFGDAARRIASESQRTGNRDVHDEVVEALGEWELRFNAADHAKERICLYAPALRDLCDAVTGIAKFDVDADRHLEANAVVERRYRSAVDRLVATARPEIGILPPPTHQDGAVGHDPPPPLGNP